MRPVVTLLADIARDGVSCRVEVDADDLESLRTILLVELFDLGQVFGARTAPRRLERHQHDAPSII